MRLAQLVLLAFATSASHAASIQTQDGRAQPGQPALMPITLQYQASGGTQVQSFRVRYVFDAQRISISPPDIEVLNPIFECAVEGGSIRVETAGLPGGGNLFSSAICRIHARLVPGLDYAGFQDFQFVQQEQCTGASCPLNNLDPPSIDVVEADIASMPSNTSVVQINATRGGSAPVATVRINSTGEPESVLELQPAFDGALPLELLDVVPVTLPSGDFADFRVRCLTGAGGSFAGNLDIVHNAFPRRPSPFRFQIRCDVTAPPDLAYAPPPGTPAEIVIPGTPSSLTTAQIDVSASGGAGASRALSCTPRPGYGIAVVNSPFLSGGTGRIALGCLSTTPPGPTTLVCDESPSTGAKAWNIRCDANPIFTATPSFATPVTLAARVGSPASPEHVFTVQNTGTPGTTLDIAAPTGLSGALSITPSTGQALAAGAQVQYAISCSPAASFAQTQNLVLAHNGPGSPAALQVTCNVTLPPALDYAPDEGLQVGVAASVGGATRTTAIGVTTVGGDPGGSLDLSCTAPPGFTVSVETSPVVTGSSAAIRLGCTTLSPLPGNLSCTETPGGDVRQWPLVCQNRPIYTSSPRPSSALGVYGAIGETFASGTIGVTNNGTAILNISSCVGNPAGLFGINSPASVPPLSSASIQVDCVPPVAGTTLAANLACNTDDPARPTVLYRLFCVAPPDTDPGESSSPVDRLSSPSPDSDALLGSAASIGTGPDGEEILVAGAPNAGADGNGRVYVFVRAPGSQATLGLGEAKRGREPLGAPAAVLAAPVRGKSTRGSIGNKFGAAVAVSPDGMAIAVGAPISGSANIGQVLVFARPAGGWGAAGLESLVPVVIEPPAASGVVAGEFGAEVAYADDGTLVVGAPGAIVSTLDDAGAAYRFDAANAPLGAPVTSATPATNAAFGAAVDAGSGLIAIGAPGESNETGAVYVYDATAASLGPQNRQTAPGGNIGDKFGAAVAIGGGAVIVGAPNDDTSAGADSGSATVLLQGSGNAVQVVATLVPDAGTAEGAGASIATNGDIVVLGAPLTDVTVGGTTDVRRGRAIVFDLDAAAVGDGRPAGVYENSIGDEGDDFGSSIAISRTRLLVGAPLSDEGTDLDEGRVDPFVLDRIFRGGFDR